MRATPYRRGRLSALLIAGCAAFYLSAPAVTVRCAADRRALSAPRVLPWRRLRHRHICAAANAGVRAFAVSASNAFAFLLLYHMGAYQHIWMVANINISAVGQQRAACCRAPAAPPASTTAIKSHITLSARLSAITP